MINKVIIKTATEKIKYVLLTFIKINPLTLLF
jgi:hypothetical protein